MFNIAFYRDKDGNSEIIDFLDELQRKGNREGPAQTN